MSDPDIVARLRALASEFPTLDGIMDSEWTNAADEIERLRRDYSCICGEMRRMMEERDEARRLWCVDIGELYSSSSLSLAKERGWDCFKEATDGR